MIGYHCQCICEYAGMIPSSVCQISSLNIFYILNGGANTGVTCAPSCLSSVPNCQVPATACTYSATPSNQDNGLCGIIAATNIQSKASYSQWSCSASGLTSTTPCSAPVWTGLTCTGGSTIVAINLNNAGITGINN